MRCHWHHRLSRQDGPQIESTVDDINPAGPHIQKPRNCGSKYSLHWVMQGLYHHQPYGPVWAPRLRDLNWALIVQKTLL